MVATISVDSNVHVLTNSSKAAMSMASKLTQALGQPVEPAFLYEHPSARQVATALYARLHADNTSASALGAGAAAAAPQLPVPSAAVASLEDGPPLRCLLLHGDGADAELMEHVMMGMGWWAGRLSNSQLSSSLRPNSLGLATSA